MYKDPIKQKEAQHKGYLKNKAKVLDRNKQRRLERKLWMAEFLKGKSCAHCDESNPVCLDFHHKNPRTKVDTVSRMINEFRSMKSIIKEIKKCILVCANCHRKIHAGEEV